MKTRRSQTGFSSEGKKKCYQRHFGGKGQIWNTDDRLPRSTALMLNLPIPMLITLLWLFLGNTF